MNSGIYKLSTGWICCEIGKIFLVGVVLGYLFFDSVFAVALLLPSFILFWKIDNKKRIGNMQKKLKCEFKDFIFLISGNLNAGYSMENSFIRAKEEFEKNREEGILVKPLAYMANGMSYNTSLEDMFFALGRETGIDEIEEFGNLIKTAKLHGGNMIKLIKETVNSFSEKYQVEAEIETMIAAKKLEGRIMLMAPLGIILYMRMTNGVYMEILYQTGMGRMIMFFCLGAVIFSWVMIEKIIDIEV